MMKTQTKQTGFTLIELMIVIAIIGILAAIAVPQYQTYTNKAKFAEVVRAAGPFKSGIEICYLETSTFACQGATGQIPPDVTTANGNVASVTVASATGQIVATASGSIPVSPAPTYILTPTAAATTASAMLVWAKTGTCVAAGLC